MKPWVVGLGLGTLVVGGIVYVTRKKAAAAVAPAPTSEILVPKGSVVGASSDNYKFTITTENVRFVPNAALTAKYGPRRPTLFDVNRNAWVYQMPAPVGFAFEPLNTELTAGTLVGVTP